ncbi:hypothetical protein AMECASPLE_025225 [Ameca splendens]|uniref:Uncharacterized protein n=1 Tax=Ameca splendens TaxID=208324 RepID=A0ABV0ZE78_9TELE
MQGSSAVLQAVVIQISRQTLATFDQLHHSVPMTESVDLFVWVCDPDNVCLSVLCQQKSQPGQQWDKLWEANTEEEKEERRKQRWPNERQKEGTEAEVNVSPKKDSVFLVVHQF